MRSLHWMIAQEEMSISLPPLPESVKQMVRSSPTWAAVHALEGAFKGIYADVLGQGLATPMFSSEKWLSENPDQGITGYATAVATYVVFAEKGAKIFKIARDFGEALEQVNCAVSPKYLKFNDDLICIEFPDNISFDLRDGDFGHCAYVGMYRKPEEQDGSKYCMEITVPLYHADGSYTGGRDNVRLILDEDQDIETSLVFSQERMLEKHHDWKRSGISPEFIRYLVKCLLYINSGDPDLRHLRPEPKPKNAKALKRWRRENVEAPVTVVGFDYKKPKVYREGEVFVRSHPRWQPCGPGRSQIKLVWVKEHVKTYGVVSELQPFQKRGYSDVTGPS